MKIFTTDTAAIRFALAVPAATVAHVIKSGPRLNCPDGSTHPNIRARSAESVWCVRDEKVVTDGPCGSPAHGG